MTRLLIALLLATFGGSLIIHWLRNFILQEKSPFQFEWDSLLERTCLTYIMISAQQFWPLIPIIIVLKLTYRLFQLGSKLTISTSDEPGNAWQKVLFKSELSFDLFLSPAWAIMIGVIWQ